MEENNNMLEEQNRELIDVLKKEEMDNFRQQFLQMHPYDQAQFFIEQEEHERFLIYYYLSPDELGQIMINIDLEETEAYFSEMDPQYASSVLAKMPADDAVDILNELDKEKVASFLTIMGKKSAAEIKALLHYEEKTAGSIMTTEFVAFNVNDTKNTAMQLLKEHADHAETIYYLYVMDDLNRLVGVLSLRELIVAEDDTLIGDIMDNNVVSVSVGRDQEDIVQMIRDYDFLALPVVDFQNHLLGIITVDDVLDVMDEEASDDYSKLAAVADVQKVYDNPFEAAKKRLPWLIVLLFLGMFTASLISRFEATLEQVAILAIFIPLIAGMAGNTGTQSLAVAVRGLATGDFGKQGKIKLMMKEASTGLIIGTVCGVVITIVIYFWKGQLFLGFLVGISILATLTVATLSGSLIPIVMDKLNIDPAVASGPFITTINDIISILIYFGIATAFLGFLL